MPDGGHKTEDCHILPMPGVTVLKFPDGSTSTILGLDDIIARAHADGRPATRETAGEILKKVAERGRIDRSKREWYRDLLLEEYRKYCEAERATGMGIGSSQPARDQIEIGMLAKVLFRILPPSHLWS